MNTVVRSKTGPALPSKWQRPWPTEIGAERTGFRISPLDTALAAWSKAKKAGDLYRYLVAELNKLNLAYLHFIHTGDEKLVKDLRKAWSIRFWSSPKRNRGKP